MKTLNDEEMTMLKKELESVREEAVLIQFGGSKFGDAFVRWLNEANQIASGVLTFSIGKKYIKLISDDRSAYGFIDKEGNVLYAASWSRPAKNVRGSIYSDKKADGAGKYSVLYVSEVKKER